MEPQNTENIAQPASPAQTTPVEAGSIPAPEAAPVKASMLSSLQSKLTEKFAGIKAGGVPKPKIPKKLFIALALMLLVLVLLVVASRVMNLTDRNGAVPSPTTSPTPEPTVEAEVPSQYADDADVAEIRSAMEQLDRDLNDANFREDRLRVPALDWEVEFN